MSFSLLDLPKLHPILLFIFWGFFISFHYKSIEVHFPLLFLDTCFSWKSLFCAIAALFAVQICSTAVKCFKLGINLSNKQFIEKNKAEKKELQEILNAILNESGRIKNNPDLKLIIVKAYLVRHQNNSPICLENLGEFEILDDLTLVFQLYNQGTLIDLPANKVDLIGFEQSIKFQEGVGSLFVAYSIKGSETEVKSAVYALGEPIKISI